MIINTDKLRTYVMVMREKYSVNYGQNYLDAIDTVEHCAAMASDLGQGMGLQEAQKILKQLREDKHFDLRTEAALDYIIGYRNA